MGRICSSFGGGGHYSAASATILDLTLEEVLHTGNCTCVRGALFSLFVARQWWRR